MIDQDLACEIRTGEYKVKLSSQGRSLWTDFCLKQSRKLRLRLVKPKHRPCVPARLTRTGHVLLRLLLKNYPRNFDCQKRPGGPAFVARRLRHDTFIHFVENLDR